jgi:uncharacterized membrane protein YdjX (TVP38/TMEM64 family)
VVAAFLAAGLLLPHSPYALRDMLLATGIAAPAIGLAAWALLTPALFPGAVLGAASGLAFGALGGAALALTGAVIGGLVAFSLSRTVARTRIERALLRRPRLSRLNATLERRGFAAMLAARLVPGMPVSWLHYAAGVSKVRLRAFTGAMAVGALLRTAPYALLGQGLAAGSVLTVLFAVGSIAIGGLAATVLLRRLRMAPAPA